MRQLLSCALVVALTAGLSAGCGKSAEEKAAEDLKAATEKAAEAMAQAGAAAAQAGAAAAQAGAPAARRPAPRRPRAWKTSPRRCRAWPRRWPVRRPAASPPTRSSFRDLQTAFPAVNGWTMDKPKGERMTSPIAFSQTETQLPQRRRPHRDEDRRLGLPADAGGAVGDVPGGRLREGNRRRLREVHRAWPVTPASRNGTTAASRAS